MSQSLLGSNNSSYQSLLGNLNTFDIKKVDLSGNVTGKFNNNIVNIVGGKTSIQISNTVDAVLNATSDASANTIMKRDSNADVSVNQLNSNNIVSNNIHSSDIITSANQITTNNINTTNLKASANIDVSNNVIVKNIIQCGDPSFNSSLWYDIPGAVNAVYLNCSQVKATSSDTFYAKTSNFYYPMVNNVGTVDDYTGQVLVCVDASNSKAEWKTVSSIALYGPTGATGAAGMSFTGATGANGLSFTGATGAAGLSFTGPTGQAGPSTLLGEVTGLITSNTVASVGGKTSASISTSVDDTLNATSNNTNGTIVKRNATGGFNTSSINLQASTDQLKLRETIIRSTDLTARTFTLPAVDSDSFTMNAAAQSLTNKTIIQPYISQIRNAGTLTLPTTTDTLVGRATTDTLTNKTLTAPVISTIVNTGTLTLPNTTDTLVGRATTDTLTNKTLTTPNISQIRNTNLLTLPNTTDTLVGRATTDTLTNKTLVNCTLSGPTLSGTVNNLTNTFLINQANTINSTFPVGMRFNNAHFAVPTSTTVNNTIEFFKQELSNGSYILNVNLIASGLSVSKQYHFNVCYDMTGDTFFKLLPTKDSIYDNGQDFEILMKMRLGFFTLRLRKTSGTTAGIAYISIQQYGSTNDFTNLTQTVTTDTTVYSANLPLNDSYVQGNNLYSRSASIGTNNQNSLKARYSLLSAETSKAGSFCSVSDGEIAMFKTNTYTTTAGNDCLSIWSPLGSGSTRIDAYVPFYSNSIVNNKNYYASCYLFPEDATAVASPFTFQLGFNSLVRFKFLNSAARITNSFPVSNYLKFGINIDGNSESTSDISNFDTIRNISGKTLLLDIRVNIRVAGAYYFNSSLAREDYSENNCEVTGAFISGVTANTKFNHNAIIRLENNQRIFVYAGMFYNGNSNFINQPIRDGRYSIYLISEL